MQSFGDESNVTYHPGETPDEIKAWDDPSAWTPEEELPLPRIPDGVPEADLLEQYLPA